MNRLFLFCLPIIIFFPLSATADILINEIAWMGTSESATSEWIELYNSGGEAVDLEGWIIEAEDGSPSIALSSTIAAGEFFLLERTDDDSLPNIAADLIYTGALSNSGETLVLKYNDTEVDLVNAAGGWLAGDNDTKETMQWNGVSWFTAPPTPKALNVSDSQEEPPNDDNGSTPIDNSGDNNNGGGSSTGSPSVHYSPIPISNISRIENIYMSAGRDRLAFVDIPIFFEALTFFESGDRKIGGSGSYRWSLGDGSTAYGESIFHKYLYPGEYIVSLNARYGNNEAYSRAKVKVVEAKMKISNIGEDFVEISNESEYEINLYNWELLKGRARFKFPKDTIVPPKTGLIFPRGVTKIGGEGRVQLTDPNGNEVASIYTKTNSQLEVFQTKIEEISKTLTEMEKEVYQIKNNNSPVVISAPTAVLKENKTVDEKKHSTTKQTALAVESFEIEPPDGLFKTIFMLPVRTLSFLKNLIF